MPIGKTPASDAPRAGEFRNQEEHLGKLSLSLVTSCEDEPIIQNRANLANFVSKGDPPGRPYDQSCLRME